MRKTKTNEAQRQKQAESIRRRGLEQMAEHDPSAAVIREQEEQMRREDVAEFVARKYGIDAVKGEIAGGQEKTKPVATFEKRAGAD